MIIAKFSDLVAQPEELKFDRGKTPRTVRQLKKGVRSKYAALAENKERLTKSIRNKQKEIIEEKRPKERRLNAGKTKGR